MKNREKYLRVGKQYWHKLNEAWANLTKPGLKAAVSELVGNSRQQK